MPSESYEKNTHLTTFASVRPIAHSLFSRFTEPAADRIAYDDIIESINTEETGAVWMSVSIFVSLLLSVGGLVIYRLFLLLPAFFKAVTPIIAASIPKAQQGTPLATLYTTVTTIVVFVQQGRDVVQSQAQNIPGVEFLPILFAMLFAVLLLAALLYFPVYISGERQRKVDAGYLKVVLHMRALSAGGMSGGKIFESVADSTDVYGMCAEEIARVHNIASRSDGSVESGVATVRDATSSEKIENFLDGYLRTLRVGGNEKQYITQQADIVIEQREKEIDQFANFIQYASLGYIIGLVVAPVVVIAIFGALAVRGQSFQGIAQAIVYFVVPLFSLGAMVAIKILSGAQDIEARRSQDKRDYTQFLTSTPDISALKYKFYSLIDRPGDADYSFKKTLRTLLVSPPKVLIVSVPAALAYAGVLVFTSFGPADLLDYYFAYTLHLFAIPYLIAITPLAVLHEYERRRVMRIRRSLPTVFDNIAEANKQGLNLTEAIGVASGDSTTLRTELRNTVRQVNITNNLNTSLNNLAGRIRSDELLRSTKLMVQANELSANVQSTISVIARNLERQYKIAEQRRNDSLKYVVLIFISFFMSLYMTFVVDDLFFQRLSEQLAQIDSANRDAGVSPSDVLFFRQLFLHSTTSIGITSGYFMGVIKSDSILAGAKFTIVFLTIAVVFFKLLIVP